MATEDISFRVKKLTGDSYHSWKFQMKMCLIGKDLWEIVTGTDQLAEGATDAEQRKFRRRENFALASVCLSVATNLQIYVRSAKSAKEAVRYFIVESCILLEWIRARVCSLM